MSTLISKPIKWMQAMLASILASTLAVGGSASAADKVRFGTDWLAEADHGGFYQAVADGTYAKYGLDVEIVQGGPNTVNQSLLVAGKIDFFMGTPQNVLNAVEQGIPLVDVAAIYQKAPQVLLAHNDSRLEKLEDLSKLPTIFMTPGGFTSYFGWMKATFPGFRDEQFKPYNFSAAPFLADENSAQQGLITSEPYEIERQTGVKPRIFLLADSGYTPYAETITVRADLIERNPDLVQRFVDASIIGWYHYLSSTDAQGNALIKVTNPDMTDGQLTYAIEKIREYGIVNSGDAIDKGIGCINGSRYERFARELIDLKLLKPETDYRRAYTTRFVCKRVGLTLRK